MLEKGRQWTKEVYCKFIVTLTNRMRKKKQQLSIETIKELKLKTWKRNWRIFRAFTHTDRAFIWHLYTSIATIVCLRTHTITRSEFIKCILSFLAKSSHDYWKTWTNWICFWIRNNLLLHLRKFYEFLTNKNIEKILGIFRQIQRQQLVRSITVAVVVVVVIDEYSDGGTKEK